MTDPMTGRQKIEAAFSPEGTPQTPAVICYEDIYVRDHWDELTSCPWWYQHVPDIARQVLWRRRATERTGQDWFHVPLWYSREDRDNISVEVRSDGVLRVDRRTGEEERLTKPLVGGWQPSGQVHSVRPAHLAQTASEVDAAIPIGPHFDPHEVARDGRTDLAAALLREFGDRLYPLAAAASPLWQCYYLWGFEGMMEMIARHPDLVRRACGRFLALAIRSVGQAARAGAEAIWIEECLTDMISPAAFESLNVPFVRGLVAAIRELGLKSIYYYCGDPAGKWDQLLSAGADALSLEEGKKGFAIDIEEAAERVGGRCTLLGNLDAIRVLEGASEDELRAEIRRQISAGRRNGGRFIMSLGSPVTPGTSVQHVRRYCDLVRDLSEGPDVPSRRVPHQPNA